MLSGLGYCLPGIIANDHSDCIPTPKVMVPYLHKVQTPQGMPVASQNLVYYGGIEKDRNTSLQYRFLRAYFKGKAFD